MCYRVIDLAGRWLTPSGFTSYNHNDSLKFNTLQEAQTAGNATMCKYRVEFI